MICTFTFIHEGSAAVLLSKFSFQRPVIVITDFIQNTFSIDQPLFPLIHLTDHGEYPLSRADNC